MTRRRRPINLSRDAFRHLAAALGIVTLLSTAHADWTLVTGDFNKQANLTINTWTAADGLSVNSASGKLTAVASRDVVSLESGRKVSVETSARRWKLGLRNGDLLLGDPAGFSGQSMLFKTPESELGTVAVPLKLVALLASSSPDIDGGGAAADKDVVRLRNGDRLEGIIANIDDTKVQLATEGAEAPTDIPLANVSSILFGGAAPPRIIPPLLLRVRFVSGTIYSIPLDAKTQAFNWSISNVIIKDAAGQEHTCSSDMISSLEVLGGRVVYLTELDPGSEIQTTFLGTKWPAQIDKNVLGQPLRVARTAYDRGIGVHTQSILTYELDGTFETLSFRIGMDDSAAPQGEAGATVTLDGKVLWQSETLKPGEISGEINLPIKGGKQLQLSALPTARLDVLGRVDWVNVALKRK